MERYGIMRGLLLSPPLQGATSLPNDKIITLCTRSDGRLAPVITVEPTAKDVKAALKLAEENKKEVKAFKIRLGYVKASAQSPVFNGLYDYAESERLPVLFHTGDTAFSTGDLSRSHPLTLDGLANKREGLTMILCHFGNPWFADVAELIYKHPNVYTDISGLITGNKGYAEKYVEWLAKKISEARSDTAFSTGDLSRSHPLTLDGLANKREGLTMILCHFGNPWFADVAELIYKHPNVYTDISGLITGNKGYAEKYVEWLAKKISEARS